MLNTDLNIVEPDQQDPKFKLPDILRPLVEPDSNLDKAIKRALPLQERLKSPQRTREQNAREILKSKRNAGQLNMELVESEYDIFHHEKNAPKRRVNHKTPR